jgi:orotate phosphoribosyltransferase
MNTEEKRRYKRYPVNLDINLACPSVNDRGKISSLSLGGCFIKSPVDLPIGEAVGLEIHSPLGSELLLEGKTVYSVPSEGFGVKFNRLSREHVISVVHLIEDAKNKL